MRYMLLMQGTEAKWLSLAALPSEDLAGRCAFLAGVERELETAGELVDRGTLAGPAAARIVRATGGSAPVVTAATFTGAREFVTGYWVVDCESHERAVAIAGRLSASPGPGGSAENVPVELRVLMRAPGEEM